MHIVEGLTHEDYEKHPDAQQSEAQKQETYQRPAMTLRDDGLNMDEAERRKDKSTTEIERSLCYLKIKFVRSIRDPKFILEVATFLVFVAYGIYTGRMYYANRDAADAAKSAADTAASQLELTERPWVDASIAIDGPFSFHINGDSVEEASIPLKIVPRNTGHSPALSAAIFWRLTLAKGDDIFKVRDEACKSAEATTNNGHWGITLFPNTTSPHEERKIIRIGKTEIEKSKVWGLSGFENKTMPPPSIVICIAYRPTFKNTSVYHTAYIFDLLRLDSTNTASYFKIGENVDQGHLLLKGHEVDAISAD
jgi:hypothetical protein